MRSELLRAALLCFRRCVVRQGLGPLPRTAARRSTSGPSISRSGRRFWADQPEDPQPRADHEKYPHRRRKADHRTSPWRWRSTTRSAAYHEEQFPHRPLSPASRAEPDGAALRKRALRAAVELVAYRSCSPPSPNPSASKATPVLYDKAGAARHGAEPYPVASLPCGDGSPLLHAGRSRPRREAQGAQVAQADQYWQ